MGRPHVLLTLLVAFMVIPLSGCVSDGTDGSEGAEGPRGEQGMQGLNGTDGIDGLNGTNGTNGTDGVNGTNGTNGKSTLIQTFTDYPGEHCEEGGLGLHVGVDDDGDGYLSIDEIDETTYVCNGANGQDGADGNGGSSGGNSGGGSSSTMLSDSIRLSKSDGCPAGGRLFAFGLDNGDQGGTAGNGVLETGEIDDQTTYCSAQRLGMVADALPGENGSKPTSYQGMKLTVEDTLYFSANDGIHGEELWAYNTTTDEMWMVADIRPGGLGATPVIGWAFNTARKFSLVPSPTMPGTNSGHTTTAQARRGWLPTSVMTSPVQAAVTLATIWNSCTETRSISLLSRSNTPPNCGPTTPSRARRGWFTTSIWAVQPTRVGT